MMLMMTTKMWKWKWNIWKLWIQEVERVGGSHSHSHGSVQGLSDGRMTPGDAVSELV